MPNTPGIIKTESAPAFFRMHCADLKWIFYIYRLNRVFWDSPTMQLLSSQSLTCTRPTCSEMLKQSGCIRPGCKDTCTAPGTQQCSQKLAGLQGPRLHLTKCLLAIPLATQSSLHSQGISMCTDLPPS